VAAPATAPGSQWAGVAIGAPRPERQVCGGAPDVVPAAAYAAHTTSGFAARLVTRLVNGCGRRLISPKIIIIKSNTTSLNLMSLRKDVEAMTAERSSAIDPAEPTLSAGSTRTPPEGGSRFSPRRGCVEGTERP
jgi:hypothetical protein